MSVLKILDESSFAQYRDLVAGIARGRGGITATFKNEDFGSVTFQLPGVIGQHTTKLTHIVLEADDWKKGLVGRDASDCHQLAWLDREVSRDRDYWAGRMRTDKPNTAIDVSDGMINEKVYHMPRPTFVVDGVRFTVRKATFDCRYFLWNGTESALEEYRARESAKKAAEAEEKRLARNARAKELREQKKAAGNNKKTARKGKDTNKDKKACKRRRA